MTKMENLLNEYKVFWVDDEFDQMDQLVIEAENEGILLEGHKSFEEARETLEKDIDLYDAVLLDARFYLKKDQVGGEDLTAFNKTINMINNLQGKRNRNIPYFIFTGQSDLTKESSFAEQYQSIIYVKGSDSEQLWKDIKDAANNDEITQLRHVNAAAFEAFDYLEKTDEIILIELLKAVKYPGKLNEDLLFNPLRKLLEAVLFSTNKYGLLHDGCVKNGKMNLTWACLFLSGKEVNMQNGNFIISKVKCFPDIISKSAWEIKELSSIGSHYEYEVEKEERLDNKAKLKELEKYVKSPYLFDSLVYRLMDILIWLKNYIDQNGDPVANKTNWIGPYKKDSSEKDNSEIVGTIKIIEGKSFGFLEPENGGDNCFIRPDLIKEEKLSNGKKVQVEIKKTDRNPEVVRVIENLN